MATNRPKLTFLRGGTYTFDVSAPLLATHPFKFTADSGATEYTTGVTLTGTQGQAGASLSITVSDSAPNNLNYYCGDHGLSKGNHIMIPDAPPPPSPDSDGSFIASPYRSHLNVTAAAGTLYTGSAGTVYYMAIDEGVPAVNDSDGTFFTDSDITVTIDSDYQYGGGHDLVFNINATGAPWYGDRAITMGGYYTNTAGTASSPNGNNGEQYITYYSISTAGTASDFGDMTTFSNKGSASFGAASNGTRVVTIAGEEMGASFSGTDDINYYTTAVPSNTTFFGNLIVPSAGYMGSGTFAACDGTKAIMGGGWAYTTAVQYGSNQGLQQITVDTTGNATYQAPMGQQLYSAEAWNNSTQALIYGANDTQTGIDKAQIYYYTFDTTADCVSFGNINTTNANGDTVHWISEPAISGDKTYMLICGGRHYDYISGSNVVRSESDEIDYVSMATTGNASAFGSLTGERRNMVAASDGTYTTLAGGAAASSNPQRASWGSGTNQIERIVVQTPGNASDFSDLIYYHRSGTGSSGSAA